MLNLIAGFFNYNPDFLAKSGVFADYCAHGLLPISAVGSSSVIDGIESGKHYWVPNINRNDLEDQFNWQTMADNSYYWYQNHNLLVHIHSFANQLFTTF